MTAFSDALIYLSRSGHAQSLVDGTDAQAQIALIKQLAALMQLDPTTGTPPDRVLTGLRRYVKRRGFEWERLEAATWRLMRGPNRKYLVGEFPQLRGCAPPPTT